MEEKIEDSSPRAEHIHEPDTSYDEKVDPEARDRLRQLTDAELAVEKKLLRKIDIRIMPIVVLVYLLNYIDRCESLSLYQQSLDDADWNAGTTMLLHGFKALRRTSI